MWQQIDPTRAAYRACFPGTSGNDRQSAVSGCSILVDGPGGSEGWQLSCRLAREPISEAHEEPWGTFQLHSVSAKTIPQLSESYIRGEDLVLTYSQQETDLFGLSIQVTPIECSERVIIVQLTISLQTDLLESYPTIEFSAASAGKLPDASKSPAVVGPRQLASADEVYGTILFSPRDQQAVDELSDGDALRVQLFGNFLEKGVIRKSRPWFVIWRGSPPGISEIESVYQRLRQTPLPLTT